MTTSLSNGPLRRDERAVYDIPRQSSESVIYDTPRKIIAPSVLYQNDFVTPIEHNLTKLRAELRVVIDEFSVILLSKEKSLASRPLPLLPIASPTLEKSEAIYEPLNFSTPLKPEVFSPSEKANKLLSLFEKLHDLLKGLEKTLGNILQHKAKHSIPAEKVFVKDLTPPTLTSEAKKALDIAEFRFEKRASLDAFQALKSSLETMKFLLEGQINNSIKIYESERGDELGANLTKHMGLAKFQLASVDARLNTLLAIAPSQPKLMATVENPIYGSLQSTAAEAKVSTVNAASFFKVEKASIHCENLDVVKSYVVGR